MALLRREAHSPLRRVKNMLSVQSERGHHLSVLDGKTIATLINQSLCAESIGFSLIPNLLNTIHRLLNINSLN